jgi:peptidoglycan hydrolase-like protein with peptidoglycan-binding domain
MFLASKKVGIRIVFALLIGAMFAASLPSFAAGSPLSEAALTAVDQNDAKKMQQALFDRGLYRGKVDGVIGLRTRASIRSFQKAANLPATGLLDPQTASKLGLQPESIRRHSSGASQNIVEGQDEPGNQSAKSKPWAGTRLTKGTRQTRRPSAKIVATGAAPEGSKESGEDGLRAENRKQPQ